ncbi:hypothetical protein [Comamonas suwonensis]|uniref:Uncharacterized protein n=1 Tax=Comamonas suwonensis TaxID=2606214 RepID=A0A843BDE4_9BURK|nr:hypothetical protein [Comamonas suwonensis]MBI1625347.1 hypothetical protein [Comamonas suwonensis]
MATSHACPLLAIDRRLAAVHRYWHEAESHYFDPDLFRSSIQTAIQTLRTVTFLIQSHKRLFQNFDIWYGAWQEKLRQDPLMRWMVDARNMIEKQGDLETFSVIKAEILASYYDEGPSWQVPAELFESKGMLLQTSLTTAEASHVGKHGVLRIQRRWVENSLPEHELLDALAIAYGRIDGLVKDAHAVLGLDPFHFSHATMHCQEPLPTNSGCLSCMLASSQVRTLHLHIESGSPMKFGSVKVEATQEELQVAADKYGIDKVAFEALSKGSLENKLVQLFEIAKKMIVIDGHHVPMVIFLKDGDVIYTTELAFSNKASKYVLMRQLGTDAAKISADGVIMISEVWSYKREKGALWSDPLNDPNRKEHLTASLITKYEDPVRLSAEIHRQDEEVHLGKTEITRNEVLPSFAPFYIAWGREIPTKWIEATHAFKE